jgi:hypothetical protein
MMLLEARRVRHFYVRRDSAPTTQPLPLHEVLTAALDGADIRAGWLDGVATLEAATIDGRSLAGVLHARLSGPIEHGAGTTQARLFVTGSHPDLGLVGVAGPLDAAKVRSLEAHVVVFDEGAPPRASEPEGAPRAGQAAAPSPAESAPDGALPAALAPPTPSASGASMSAAIVASAPPARASELRPLAVERQPSSRAEPEPEAEPPPAPVATKVTLASAPLPAPPARKALDLDAEYPEVGDHATHFLFGDCEVIDSDGERIKLKQKKDSRVREVSLSVLSLEPPTRNADGVRHFALNRKK